MNTVFADTSALYAYLVAEDRHHAKAKRVGHELMTQETILVTHSFVLCEMVALLQSRIGLDAVEQWHNVLVPVLEITWVDAKLYQRARQHLMTHARRHVSMTDHLSFTLMRERDITTAFAFDPHFKQFGFRTL